MAQVTSTDGVTIHFKPDAVNAAEDHYPVGGQVVTGVQGISTGVVFTSEPAQAFLTRVGIAASFAQLTKPDGYSIWLNGKATASISTPPSTAAYGAQSLIMCGGPHYVTEDADTARAALNAAGGHL